MKYFKKNPEENISEYSKTLSKNRYSNCLGNMNHYAKIFELIEYKFNLNLIIEFKKKERKKKVHKNRGA